mgnify:CR=1 FL=1
MDLKPSELMQIDDVPVAYSCIIIKVSLKHTSMIPFDPLIIILLYVSKLQVLYKNKQICVLLGTMVLFAMSFIR